MPRSHTETDRLRSLSDPGDALLTAPPPLRELQPEELELLATGAWILGAGGGGSPYHAYLNAREHARRGIRVQLMDPMALADDDLVAVVSNMGAPLVGQERLSDPSFAVKPVRMMEDYLGTQFRAVMSLEIGGGNAIQPLLVAAETGLPVVDADCMGRAYPEAQMTSFAIGDLPMFPAHAGRHSATTRSSSREPRHGSGWRE